MIIEYELIKLTFKFRSGKQLNLIKNKILTMSFLKSIKTSGLREYLSSTVQCFLVRKGSVRLT